MNIWNHLFVMLVGGIKPFLLKEIASIFGTRIGVNFFITNYLRQPVAFAKKLATLPQEKLNKLASIVNRAQLEKMKGAKTEELKKKIHDNNLLMEIHRNSVEKLKELKNLNKSIKDLIKRVKGLKTWDEAMEMDDLDLKNKSGDDYNYKGEMVPVNSTWIASISYNQQTRTLTVATHTGKTLYDYFNVSKEIFEMMKMAPGGFRSGAGSVLHRFINKYKLNSVVYLANKREDMTFKGFKNKNIKKE